MEKYLLSALLLVSFLSTVLGITCWTCDNVFGQEECLRKGFAKRCDASQDFCHLELRHEGSNRKVPRIKKSCKTLRSCGNNYVQNLRPAWSSLRNGEQVQCNEQFPSSVCRCCCSGDLCNQNQTSCLRSEIRSSCPVIPLPPHSSMECFDGFKLLSVCKFYCGRGYVGSGNMTINCGFFGSWDSPAPFCKRIQCPRIKAPKNGIVTGCRNGNYLGSRCRFECEQGYRLHGKSSVRCIQHRNPYKPGVWSPRIPECRPLQCPSLIPFRNGVVRCTDQNYIGSTCTMSCGGFPDYALNVPLGSASSLTCGRDELWDRKKPCCLLSCPPFAPMDFIVVLDSSSSVTAPNWVKMIDFVVQFVSEFAIRNDSTHVAAFRYNDVIDETSQILLSDYPEDKVALLNAIRRIPYDGSGTFTGKAINHVVDAVLRTGNRPGVRDVVLIITDGASQDPIRIPSLRLRFSGALVYVLPVTPDDGEVDIRQIETIAGGRQFRHNVFTEALVNGFEALDEEFASRVTELLCRQDCNE